MVIDTETGTITLSERERNRIRIVGAVPTLSDIDMKVMAPVVELLKHRGAIDRNHNGSITMKEAQDKVDDLCNSCFASGQLDVMTKIYGEEFIEEYEDHIEEAAPERKMSVNGFIVDFLHNRRKK